jgi:translation initiation factor IF-2
MRLSQAARQFNVGIATISDVLAKKGHKIDPNPNTKITSEQLTLLEKEFEASAAVKKEANEIVIGTAFNDVVIRSDQKFPKHEDTFEEEDELLIIDKTDSGRHVKKDFSKTSKETIREKNTEKEEVYSAKLPGLKVVDRIELDDKGRPVQKTKSPKAEPVAEQKTVMQPEQPVAAPVAEIPVAEEKAIQPEPQQPELTSEVAPPAEKNLPEPQPAAAQQSMEETEVLIESKVADEPDEIVKVQPATIESTEDVVEEEFFEVEPEAELEEDEDGEDEVIEEELVIDEAEDGSVIQAKADRLKGLKVLGKIELPLAGGKAKPKPIASSDDKKADAKDKDKKKRKRKRMKSKAEEGAAATPEQSPTVARTPAEQQQDRQKGRNQQQTNTRPGVKPKKEEISSKEVDEQYRKTMAKLSGGGTTKGNKGKYRRDKREAMAARNAEMQEAENANLLKVTEFISTNELATLMDVSVNEIIAKFLELGMFVSINQRLDAEAITIIADEFGFDVEFASAEEEIEMLLQEEDAGENTETRAPIVTIMGHVDHGKTSLLDYIRKTKVAAGEAGGITQHIGAYDVTTESGRRIVFLDTPGHEAFTAMRARGAKVTDVVVIVIAADDSVMPQTVEAINHAQVAGVPIVVAINKIDKPSANPTKIKEQLANLNILVEDWGGKVQCQEISAKSGLGVDDLLERVLLESDILELKCNSKRRALGTIIEASLDKGRGYVATVLVQNGSMEIGDIVLAGHHFGRVRAMIDSRGKRVKKVGPATPVQLLGLNGAPQAGDKLNVLSSEREARDIANKREQILREQSIRATKRTTLSDIGKRIAMGNYQQLNIILKGDVDGSVEALSDSLQKLSRDEVEVNIIHKAVGPISENDILLASASEAVVIGFQVRPTPNVRRLAEKEDVEIRLYSIIYQAIEDVKAAMEGMLSPDIEETIIGNAQVREVFKITKVGTVAGCYVTDGNIKRNSKIRIIRDGIVVFGGENGGEISALKRFKDDVAEVRQGFECGISVRNFNDIKVNDVIEAFELKEVKRTFS